MESVILEEVRKLSKVLGFQSKKSKRNCLDEERPSWSHVKDDNPFNICEDVWSDNQNCLIREKPRNGSASQGECNSDSTINPVENVRYTKDYTPELIIFEMRYCDGRP